MKTRRGDSIYEHGKLIAKFTHGAWYKPQQRPTHMTWEPIDLEEAAKLDQVARPSLSSSDGELEVLQRVEQMVATQVYGPSNRTMVLTTIRDRLVYGLNKHGPFIVGDDDRNIEDLIRSSAADTVIYACLRLCQKPQNSRHIQQIALQAVELLNHIENGE